MLGSVSAGRNQLSSKHFIRWLHVRNNGKQDNIPFQDIVIIL